MAVKIEKWVVAQKKHKLSDRHVQMARELGLNPDKLGKIDNHKQEKWKDPLPVFIERIYFKRFKKEAPDVVNSLKQQVKDSKIKKEKSKKEKEKKRKLWNIHSERLNGIIEDMKTIFEPTPYGISHTLKVLENARSILRYEKTEKLKYGIIIELAAVLHDIGAIEAGRKHGSMEGKFQEMEGPAIAKDILQKYNYDPEVIERVCFIVGNHHSPEKIDDTDFQILWEADLIEAMQVMDDMKDSGRLAEFISANFQTSGGKKIAIDRYSVEN